MNLSWCTNLERKVKKEAKWKEKENKMERTQKYSHCLFDHKQSKTYSLPPSSIQREKGKKKKKPQSPLQNMYHKIPTFLNISLPEPDHYVW